MAEPHDFDPFTMWCKRCGIAASEAVDSNRDCVASGANVTGISHLVRGHRLQSIAASILLARRGLIEPDDSA